MLVASIWTVVCLGIVATGVVRDPVPGRVQALEARLQAIQPPVELDQEQERANRAALRMSISGKNTLWSELIAPPPKPPPKQPPPPNLNKMLEGVRPSLREEIKIGDEVKVRIRMQEGGSGTWLTVGDTLRGLTIVGIRDDAVVFELKQGDKTYTTEIERK